MLNSLDLEKIIKQVATRGSFAAALICVEIHKQKMQFRPGTFIGKILMEHGGYRIGDYVLVEPYADNRGCTIEMPMTLDQIKREQSEGSLMVAWLTCVGYPLKQIEKVQNV